MTSFVVESIDGEGGHKSFQQSGPIVLIACAAPAAQADLLPAPPEILGCALVDTGAPYTSLTQKTIAALRLRPFDSVRIVGDWRFRVDAEASHASSARLLDHEGEANLYTANLTVHGARWAQHNPTAHESTVMEIGNAMSACGGACWRTDEAGAKHRVELVGLIGRNFLRHCQLMYNGPAGKMIISVDLASLHGADDP